MTTALTNEAVRFDPELGMYIASGFDEVTEVLRGSAWSSDPRRNPMAPAEIQQLPQTILVFMDPPDHGRLRRLISPAFTPRAIERLRPRIASVVQAALDGLDDDTELMSDYAYLVPLAVIAELLDVGAEGAELFQTFTPDLVKMLEFDATAEDLAASVEASLEIMLALTPILVNRKQHPGDDFISAMLAQEDITVEEVLGMCILLLAAGHETTANLIGNGALALLAHPEQQQHLFADPPRAVEELLRLEGPVKIVGRVAKDDVQLGGFDIVPGSGIVLLIDQANIDARRFKDPLRLDLSREPQGHLALGGGAHFCLGAALTRLEAAEALTRLFDRYPNMRLDVPEPVWRASTTFRALEDLPIRLG